MAEIRRVGDRHAECLEHGVAVDDLLRRAGTDKSKAVSATIYLPALATVLPNPSLKPTRYGSHPLIAPGHSRHRPFAVSRRLRQRAA